MKAFALTSFAILTSLAATTASARPATCLLQVNGAIMIEGQCDFTNIGNDGSFQISDYRNGLFAQMLMTGRGRGVGYWNETPGGNHAHSNLGDVVRDGACWSNAYATICAW